MPFELLSSEPIFQGRAFKIRRDTFKTPDGRESKYEVVEHIGSVTIVPPVRASAGDSYISVLEDVMGLKEWYDPETALEYAFHGKNRLTIVDEGGVRALCCWDENYKYVNFRYCFTDPTIKGISDYARVQFHRYIDFIKPGKPVNDGGCLDNVNLLEYKLHLNPYSVNKIFGGKNESK